MKAVVLTKYGSPDGFELREIEKPTPKDNEILIRVRATTVTAGDTEVRTLKFPFYFSIPIRLYMGILRPRRLILGQELAGEIEAVGKDVTRFKVGDAVFGTTGIGFGGYAEYRCLPETSDSGGMTIKPSNMSFEEAAAVPTAGFEALHFLRKANIQPGEKVLVFGAGGSIGTFGVQIAKYYGAEVTGLDSTGKLDMLRSIGADHVIDYTQEDFTKGGQQYDVIFDVIGKSSYSGCIRSLKPNGRYLVGNPKPSYVIRRLWTSMQSGKKVILAVSGQDIEDLNFPQKTDRGGKDQIGH